VRISRKDALNEFETAIKMARLFKGLYKTLFSLFFELIKTDGKEDIQFL